MRLARGAEPEPESYPELVKRRAAAGVSDDEAHGEPTVRRRVANPVAGKAVPGDTQVSAGADVPPSDDMSELELLGVEP